MHDGNAQKADTVSLPADNFHMWPNDGDYPNFSETLKDCEGKCLEYIPEGTTRERIAVLRPPGAFGDMFTRYVQNVVDYYWSNTTNLVLIPTSHVPPYGYGKTHGFTKIIRLSVSPLMTHGADLMGSGDHSVAIQDLKQVARQLVRWHCRLSHVAAHTALLTITFDNMISQAWDTGEQIRDFLKLSPKRNGEQLTDDGFLEVDELVAQLENVMKRITKILAKASDSEFPQPIEDVIHNVIQDELDKTNNLKKWPCLSFWSVGDEPNPETLTPLATHLAKSFSPNCTAEFTQCGVPKDRCEERGDAKCK